MINSVVKLGDKPRIHAINLSMNMLFISPIPAFISYVEHYFCTSLVVSENYHWPR